MKIQWTLYFLVKNKTEAKKYQKIAVKLLNQTCTNIMFVEKDVCGTLTHWACFFQTPVVGNTPALQTLDVLMQAQKLAPSWQVRNANSISAADFMGTSLPSPNAGFKIDALDWACFEIVE